jgi:Protein of unknown function (DUF4054)
MTVTVASFRKDFAQTFGNQSQYPTDVIQYWVSIGQLLLGMGTGSPPQVCSFTGAIGAAPNPSKVLAVSEIDFGNLMPLPLLLTGASIIPQMTILEQLTGVEGQLGTYQVSVQALIAAEAMVALANVSPSAGNPFWGPASLTADSPPTTIADFALEQWVAHQIVLEKQAMQAAAAGGDPGTKIGVISSKSVNGVSVGFDVGVVTGKDTNGAGYYNQTIYGQRFWRLARARSAGPIQVGIGIAPPFSFFNNWGLLGSSNAWGGPGPQYPVQGDTGF